MITWRCAVAALILLATPVTARCEVYKSIDPNGRVIYSDKPEAGSAPTTHKPVAAGVVTSGLRALEGEWNVASVTFEGAPSVDNKLLNGRWSFANDELAIEQANGEKLRYSVRIEPGYPATFTVTPIAAANERGGWMIYAREGSRLRIAFFDNLETRPTGFEPQRKLAVVTLLPRNAADARTAAAKRSACDILRAAGVGLCSVPRWRPRRTGSRTPRRSAVSASLQAPWRFSSYSPLIVRHSTSSASGSRRTPRPARCARPSRTSRS